MHTCLNLDLGNKTPTQYHTRTRHLCLCVYQPRGSHNENTLKTYMCRHSERQNSFHTYDMCASSFLNPDFMVMNVQSKCANEIILKVGRKWIIVFKQKKVNIFTSAKESWHLAMHFAECISIYGFSHQRLASCVMHKIDIKLQCCNTAFE